VLWLSVVLVVGFWWGWLRGQGGQYRGEMEIVLDVPSLDGLQFIDANHPYIRVGSWTHLAGLALRLTRLQYVGRWLATADGTHKDGSFPGEHLQMCFLTL
tara:strand:+ start:1290 stop:1589 length:300 start_codon:yes stop_codon:yes gene_type:complete